MRRSKKVNGKKVIHAKVLGASDPDLVVLGEAVQQRFLDLLGSWERVRGERLIPPAELDSDMLLWRTMVVRHRKGDYRNTADEENATKRIAQWTVDKQCELRNQPRKIIDWR